MKTPSMFTNWGTVSRTQGFHPSGYPARWSMKKFCWTVSRGMKEHWSESSQQEEMIEKSCKNIITYLDKMLLYFMYSIIILIMATTNTINISSFNCTGIKSSTEYIAKSICANSDIIALQELWILPNEVELCQTIHNEFTGFSKSSVDVEKGVLRGPGTGVWDAYSHSLMGLWHRDFSRSPPKPQYEINLRKTYFNTTIRL